MVVVALPRLTLPLEVRFAAVKVVPSKVRFAESVNTPAAARYGMRFVVRLETVRLVVEAVPKYPVPLAVTLVVDAPPLAVKRPELIVEDAVEMNPANVESPETFRVETRLSVPAERTPMFPFVLYRFVELAVVLKRFVVVALLAVSEDE